MQNILIDFFATVLIVLVSFYMISIMVKEKINFLSIRNLVILFFTVLILMLVHAYCNIFIRLLVTSLILIFVSKIIFKKKTNDIIFSVCFEQLIYLVSEYLFIFIVMLIHVIDVETLLNLDYGLLIINSCTSIIALLFFKFIIVQKFISKNVTKFKSITNIHVVIFVIFSIFLINLLISTIYFQVNEFILLLINSFFVGFVTFVVYKILDEKNKLLIQTNRTLQYKAENDALINNLHEYEKLADQHRMLNHENKNQLLAIKQMINNNEDGVISYIDKLLKTKVPDDQSLLANTKRIPSGGLQGIIYQKMLIIKKAKIKHSLNISRELKNLDFKKLDIDTNVDVCKIVGVFLDNAIEEVKGLRERMIGVDLYVEDDKLCISVSNTFGKNKDFSKIDEVGYTTKSDGHGYGLSLVREILSNNERLENTRTVTGKFFTQVIKISDMKHDDESSREK